jgi:predicted dehydrogenase
VGVSVNNTRDDDERGAGRTLRLGIAGYGRLARKYYAPALRACPGITVLVVVDPLEACRDAARAAFPGVATCADPGALSAWHLDGLIVASPPSTHLGLWNTAANLGLPVLMEKPFVLRGELPRAAAGERERRLLMIDLNRRFWPPYRQIRDAVRDRAAGELESVDISLHVDVRPWCSVTSHRLQRGEGGVLYDLGSQAVDLARWIAGMEAREVSAWSESRRWEHDHVRLELAFEDGVRARCDLAYAERGFERMAIEGRRGRIELPDPNMTVHFRERGSGPRWPLGRVRDLVVLGYRGLRRSQSMVRYTVAMALATFTDSIRRGLSFTPGFEEAAMNTRWLEAAERAIELGAPVAPDELPEPSCDRA